MITRDEDNVFQLAEEKEKTRQEVIEARKMMKKMNKQLSETGTELNKTRTELLVTNTNDEQDDDVTQDFEDLQGDDSNAETLPIKKDSESETFHMKKNFLEAHLKELEEKNLKLKNMKSVNLLREGGSKMDLIKYGKLEQKLTPSLNKQIIAERLELNKLINDYNNRNKIKPKVE